MTELKMEWIADDHEISQEDFSFDIKKPKMISFIFWTIFLNLPIIILFLLSSGSLLISIIFYAIFLIVLIILSLIISWMWKKMGHSFARKIILNAIKKYNNSKENTLFSKLLSFSFDRDMSYFLEAEIADLDLSKSFHILKTRIKELIFIDLGISILIIQIFFGSILSEVNLTLVIIMIPLIMCGVIPLLFFIIPIIWTVDDLQLRGIDKNNVIDEMENNVRNGILSKILGIGGLMLAWNFLIKLVEISNESVGSENDTITDGYFVILLLGAVLIFTSGLSYPIGIIYLQKFHAPFVNEMRREINKLLPLGVTSVRHLTSLEQDKFLNIDKNTLDNQIVEKEFEKV